MYMQIDKGKSWIKNPVRAGSSFDGIFSCHNIRRCIPAVLPVMCRISYFFIDTPP